MSGLVVCRPQRGASNGPRRFLNDIDGCAARGGLPWPRTRIVVFPFGGAGRIDLWHRLQLDAVDICAIPVQNVLQLIVCPVGGWPDGVISRSGRGKPRNVAMIAVM